MRLCKGKLGTAAIVWAAMTSLVLIALSSVPAAGQKKPNVIVIFGDDVGWGDIGRR
jgi:hypothetical protein